MPPSNATARSQLPGTLEEPFVALKTIVGAVYVFDGGRSGNGRHPEPSFRFTSEFAEAPLIRQLTSDMFSPERTARPESVVRVESSLLCSITLTSGKKLSDLPLSAYLSRYSLGVSVLAVSFTILGELTVNELIELAALVKGSAERVHANGNGNVEIYLESHDRTYASFEDFYQNMATVVRESNAKHAQFTFCCPLIYIRRPKNRVRTKTELVRRFPFQLSAIVGMWINNGHLVHASQVQAVLAKESHPLEYGFAILSPICSIEVHPELVGEAAKLRGRSLDEHHFAEWYNLVKMLEIVSLQYFVMRKADEALAPLTSSALIQPAKIFLMPFKLLLDGIILSRHRTEVLEMLSDFWNIRLTRRKYIHDVFEQAKEDFLVARTYIAVKEKVETFEKNINMIFTMSTTLFVVLLTIISTIFGAIQVTPILFPPVIKDAPPAPMPTPNKSAVHPSQPLPGEDQAAKKDNINAPGKHPDPTRPLPIQAPEPKGIAKPRVHKTGDNPPPAPRRKSDPSKTG